MDVRVTSDPQAFEEAVFPFLQQDPVLHTIIMSNVHERANGTARAEGEPSYFVSVHDPDVVGVAMRTPGRGSATEGRGTRLHKLIGFSRLGAEAGSPRPMMPAEAGLVAAWGKDCFAEELASGHREWAERHLTDATMWIWEVDGEPVSMAGYHRALFVCRVGPVYTPPERRRRGCAGALTSHLTEQILADGNQACLYTDLANPTSHRIYAAIGYQPVRDFVDYDFS